MFQYRPHDSDLFDFGAVDVCISRSRLSYDQDPLSDALSSLEEVSVLPSRRLHILKSIGCISHLDHRTGLTEWHLDRFVSVKFDSWEVLPSQHYY
jgi:hypothetical protein